MRVFKSRRQVGTNIAKEIRSLDVFTSEFLDEGIMLGNSYNILVCVLVVRKLLSLGCLSLRFSE